MRRQQEKKIIIFLEENVQWLIFLALGSGLGTILALFKRNYEPLFYSLYHFINNDMAQHYNPLNIMKDSIVTYGFQMGMMWVCGLFPVLRYLGVALFILLSSIYSFSVTSIMLLYGAKGLLIAMGVCGVQMVVVLFMLIYIGQSGHIGESQAKKLIKKNYYSLLGPIGIAAVALAGINFYIQPYIEKLIGKMVQ